MITITIISLSVFGLVTVGLFTVFIRDLVEKHRVNDKWQDFIQEHMDYSDSITADYVLKVRYLNQLSELVMKYSVDDISTEFCDKIDVFRGEFYDEYHNHIPAMRELNRTKKISSILDI